jgi:hypothetical protein
MESFDFVDDDVFDLLEAERLEMGDKAAPCR